MRSPKGMRLIQLLLWRSTSLDRRIIHINSINIMKFKYRGNVYGTLQGTEKPVCNSAVSVCTKWESVNCHWTVQIYNFFSWLFSVPWNLLYPASFIVISATVCEFTPGRARRNYQSCFWRTAFSDLKVLCKMTRQMLRLQTCFGDQGLDSLVRLSFRSILLVAFSSVGKSFLWVSSFSLRNPITTSKSLLP